LPVYPLVGGPFDLIAHIADATGLPRAAQGRRVYRGRRDGAVPNSTEVEFRVDASMATLNNFRLFLANSQKDRGAK
ncbi:MAG: hypothetical protein WCD33_08830, partial [Mycobacterium sp.]|uniref:hypothetical protein n=1 Tax=Mycobacterium sp. TaxID=1785 RepID=UPI003C782B37